MKGFFLGLFLLFPLVTVAAVRVSFSDEITKDGLDKLEQKIRRAGANLKENQERIIQIDIDSGGGNLYATMDFVKSVASLMTELNVQINTRVASDCESSCTVLFTAGVERFASRWAHFGFHSPAIASRLPKGADRNAILLEARTRWLEAVGAVDAQLSTELERDGVLQRGEMTYFSSRELNHGYVTLIN
ncbi:MAG: hypothetical protein ACJ76H_04015 [Bacteriovoracaceae bacterium]